MQQQQLCRPLWDPRLLLFAPDWPEWIDEEELWGDGVVPKTSSLWRIS